MAYDPDEVKRIMRKHKAVLTRAKNSKDPRKIIEACDAAFEAFDNELPYWPDSWHTWNIARQDAEYALRRQEAGLT